MEMIDKQKLEIALWEDHETEKAELKKLKPHDHYYQYQYVLGRISAYEDCISLIQEIYNE